jgi:hypothetical protein
MIVVNIQNNLDIITKTRKIVNNVVIGTHFCKTKRHLLNVTKTKWTLLVHLQFNILITKRHL